MTTQALEALQGRVRGPVITATDSGYDEARRVYNAMIEARPQAVVRCTTAQDVQRWCGTPVRPAPSWRSAAAGTACPASAPPTARWLPTWRACGRSRWTRTSDSAELPAAPPGAASTTRPPGTVWPPPAASSPPTGVGGLTLGGGIGYLSRGYGLSCDNLLSAQVVTADGTLLTASEHEHPDLYWSLRGGGGNFGVVTEFTYRLHPVSDIYGGPMFFELSDAPAVLAYFREVIADAPREYGGFPAFQIAPPLPFVPPDRIGDTFLAVVSCWTGSVAEGERMVQGFRDVAPTVAEHVGVMPYAALNSAFDGLYPPGLQHYWKACFVTELTDAAITAHIEHGARVPVVNSTAHIYPINGACHDVAPEATAFGHRNAAFATVIAGMWPDPADNRANTAWVKEYYAAIAAHSEPGGYVNFASGDDQPRVVENYGSNYPQLLETKRRYDPDNLFHLNQNIQP